MIITKKRDTKAVLENIRNYRRIFLVGCGECAALCATGGRPQLEQMKELLHAHGKEVTGMHLAKTGCQVLGTKRELSPHKEAIAAADCILALSCGAGAQTVVELNEDKPVCSANDSMYLGNMTRHQVFDERCSMCGECILDKTAGICPVTACPKGILIGPCGGVADGKCEVSPDLPCVWIRIYERMKKLDQLDEFSASVPSPKDWSRGARPHNGNAKEPKNSR
ncbi:MAG: hypothetical protein FD164_1824 [Nitrospirae bacterium]|nr:MAG: hypothetical protein FD164_1824 [Nitrospirota bacterium]